jgi:hypothetical protein
MFLLGLTSLEEIRKWGNAFLAMNIGADLIKYL